MTGQNIGYRRVSSVDQNLDRQLVDCPVKIDRVFEEKISGATKDRPELNKCLKYLREGDTLHVHSIDRLARDLQHLQQIVTGLNSRAVSVYFHKEGLRFSDNPKPMEKLQLQLMGAFAEFERELIRERQKEGIAIAKANGKFWGRKPIHPDTRAQIRKLAAGGTDKKTIAAAKGVSVATVYNILKEAIPA